MKKTTFMFCVLASLSLAACGTDSLADRSNSNLISENVQIPSPFVECETIKQAIELAGFNFSIPDNFANEYIQGAIEVIPEELIDITYSDGDHEIRVRKGIGNEDISGVYTHFNETNTVEVNGLKVTLKGNDGHIGVATWADNNYSYSITIVDDEITVNQEMIIEMIKVIY